MKKKFVKIVLLTLVMAALACRLPFSGGDSDTDEEVTQEIIQAEPTTSTQIEETIEVEEAGVEIALPDTYIPGDVETDLAILVEGLQAMSEEDAADIESLYENNKDDIILWAYDMSSPPTHQTSLLVMKNEEFAGMSLALIATFANVLFGSEVDSLHQETMTLGEHEVLRFLTTSENTGVVTAQAIYLFNDSGKLWMVGFFTNQEQFEDRLPTFDAAAASFTVLPQE